VRREVEYRAQSSRRAGRLFRKGYGRVYRGSAKRLKRIRWRQQTPAEVWVVGAVVFVMWVILFLELRK
jgi:hypothetical protein